MKKLFGILVVAGVVLMSCGTKPAPAPTEEPAVEATEITTPPATDEQVATPAETPVPQATPAHAKTGGKTATKPADTKPAVEEPKKEEPKKEEPKKEEPPVQKQRAR